MILNQGLLNITLIWALERYFCYNLLYHERHNSPQSAIEREKEIKDWNRKKKEALINSFNPGWEFLNSEIINWPPEKGVGPRN